MFWLRLNGTETLKEKTGSAPGRGITLTRTQDLLACKILESGGAQQPFSIIVACAKFH